MRLLAALLFTATPFVSAAPQYSVETIAGNGRASFSGDGGGAPCASLNRPTGVDVAANGDVYIADYNNDRIRRVSSDGVISTVAGSGVRGFSGDGGPATAAQLAGPYGVRVVKDGFLIADARNGRVRHVDRQGIIRTVATGLRHPVDVVTGPDGALYVAEGGGNRVSRVAADGSVSVVAGTGQVRYNGRSWLGGDGGPATAAQLSTPAALAFDGVGNLFIADLRNHAVRRIDRQGIITTVAGTGVAGNGGDGGPATAAQLNQPGGLAFEADGSLLIAEIPRIRRLTKDGLLTTVAGSTERSFAGDHGLATAASFGVLDLIAADRHGNILVADYGNHRIRKLVPLASTPAASPAGSRATDDVERLLERMRTAYQSLAFANARFGIQGVHRSMRGVIEYTRPATLSAKLEIPHYGQVTVRADGQSIRVSDPLLPAPEELPHDAQNLRAAIPANLEVISLWDWQRQLSTGDGGNMRGNDLRLVTSEQWNDRTWTVLEERTGDTLYRYFVDPETSLIWRTVVTNTEGMLSYDGRIEELHTRR